MVMAETLNTAREEPWALKRTVGRTLKKQRALAERMDADGQTKEVQSIPMHFVEHSRLATPSWLVAKTPTPSFENFEHVTASRIFPFFV